MVTRATRYPVMVDPQGQGRTWIMHREEANQLKVTQLNDKMFRNHLEVRPELEAATLRPFSWPTATQLVLTVCPFQRTVPLLREACLSFVLGQLCKPLDIAVCLDMQDCLSFGKPMLIENIEEELDPVLDPVLEHRYVKKGRGYVIALADKEVGPAQAGS